MAFRICGNSVDAESDGCCIQNKPPGEGNENKVEERALLAEAEGGYTLPTHPGWSEARWTVE